MHQYGWSLPLSFINESTDVSPIDPLKPPFEGEDMKDLVFLLCEHIRQRIILCFVPPPSCGKSAIIHGIFNDEGEMRNKKNNIYQHIAVYASYIKKRAGGVSHECSDEARGFLASFWRSQIWSRACCHHQQKYGFNLSGVRKRRSGHSDEIWKLQASFGSERKGINVANWGVLQASSCLNCNLLSNPERIRALPVYKALSRPGPLSCLDLWAW